MSLNIITDQILPEENQQTNDSIPTSLSKDHILPEEIHKSQESFTQMEQQLNKPIYSYDIEFLKKPLNSIFIRRLRPEVLPQFLGEQRKYKFIKKFAIERLQETVQRQINLMFNLNHCDDQNEEPAAEITHEIYSWTLEEYLKRRMLENFVWIDVMLKSSEICLEKYKLRKDLEELQRCVQCIFEGLLANIDGAAIDQTEHVVQHISNIKLVLEFYNNMEQELRNNENELRGLSLLEETINQIKRDSEKEFTAILLRLKINNNYICTPIEMRCQFSWYQTYVNQSQVYMDLVVKRLSKDIVAIKKKKVIEKAFDNNCMDYFYTTIDNLKSTINNIQTEFDELAEKMENILNIKRSRVDKLRDKRKFLTKELIRFNEEIEVKRIQEEAEEAEKENLRLREEEKAMAAKLIEEESKKNKKGNKKTKK